MLNKKWLAIFMIMMMAAFGVFAEDEEENESEEEKSEFATGFFNFEEESVVTVTEGEFELFETKVKTLEGGVNLNLVDDIGLALTPYAGVSDVKAKVEPAVDGFNFNFDEATVYTGLKLALAPIELLGLEFALYNVDYFGNKAANLGAAAGFGFGVGLNFDIADAFLTIELADALETTWSGVRSYGAFDASKAAATHLYNDFTYVLRFNFFNFIKDTLNTGLFIDGELETNSDWGELDFSDPLDLKYENGTYTGTELTHEFLVGIITSPIDWFEGYVGFHMMNENWYGAEFDSDMYNKKVIPQTWHNSFGIKLGAAFTVKCVTFSLEWLGKVGQFDKTNIIANGADAIPLDHDDFKNKDIVDWEKGPFTQEITFTVGVALE